jgi:hypothetical protein
VVQASRLVVSSGLTYVLACGANAAVLSERRGPTARSVSIHSRVPR